VSTVSVTTVSGHDIFSTKRSQVKVNRVYNALTNRQPNDFETWEKQCPHKLPQTEDLWIKLKIKRSKSCSQHWACVCDSYLENKRLNKSGASFPTSKGNSWCHSTTKKS